jgi:hypothetical protein
MTSSVRCKAFNCRLTVMIWTASPAIGHQVRVIVACSASERPQVATSKPSTRIGETQSSWATSRAKEDAVPAGPSLQPQCRKLCRPSKRTQSQFAYLSKKVSTVTLDHMAAVVAGCTTTGRCLKRLVLRPTKLTSTRLKTVLAGTKTTK